MDALLTPLALFLSVLTGSSDLTPAATETPTPTPAAAAPQSQPLERGNLEAWLDGLLPYALDKADIAGAVVVVVKNGQVLLSKGYGYADVKARKPVDPARTLFRPGSISKLFTWTAVMQLVEQQKIDLDSDVNAYLDFKLPERPDGVITMRHLMTHTAGFEEQEKNTILEDPKALVPLTAYVKQSIPERIFKAGSTPAYSNYATALAGYIVQRVSGQDFNDYVEGHLFKPLAMSQASFRQPLPAALASDAALGYAVASGDAKPYELVTPGPAGSLAVSGEDIAHFMLAHLSGGAFGSERILSAETTKRMHETALTFIPPLNRMMLGFYEQNYNGHRIISHGGDLKYMHSYLHLMPDDQVGLFFSTNSTGHGGALRTALFEGFLDRHFGTTRSTAVVAAEMAQAHAKQLTGVYESSRRSQTSFLSLSNLIGAVDVEANADGTISASIVKSRNGAVRRYREVEPFVWRDVNSGWRLAAQVVDGKVARLSIDEVSPFMVFEPMPWWRSASWLYPAALIALATLLLRTVWWPISALLRRRHQTVPPQKSIADRRLFLSRLAVLAMVLVALGWMILFALGLSNAVNLEDALDPLLMLLYASSLVAYVGGGLVLSWHALHSFKASVSPWVKGGRAIVAMSGLVLLWVAVAYRLISFHLNY